jgi:hypothetical protein
MTRTHTHTDQDAEDLAARQAWDVGDLGDDGHELDGDCMPVLADQFHITDLQHWLDLCA